METEVPVESRSKVAKAFVILLGGGILVQGLMFLSTLILSRIYTPASFGELGFYAGVASIVAVVAGLRFDYIAFANSNFHKSVFYSISLICAAIVLALIGVISLVAETYFIHKSNFAVLVILFCFSASLFNLGTQYLLAIGRYKTFANLRLLQVVVQISIGFLLYKIAPHWGLLCSFAVSQLLVGLAILAMLYKTISVISLSEILKCWRSNFRPALVNSLISLMQYSTPFAPVLIGGMYYSKPEIGAYFIFAQIFSAPLAIFRRSAINFLNGEVGSVAKASVILRVHKLHILRGVFVGVFLLVLGAALFFFFNNWFVTLLFGSKWLPYSVIVLPLFLFFCFDAVLQPFTTLLPLWGFHSNALGFEFLRFILIFVALPCLIVLYSLNFLEFLVSYLVAMVFVYCITLSSAYRRVVDVG